jgi:hypothetical protein
MLAPGVDPSLNREPPSAVDVRRIVLLIGLLLLLVCGAGTFILAQVVGSQSASASKETPEATEEPTLVQIIEVTSVPTDTLQPTNTDIPTNTPTLDDWSLSGTALFFSTSTATFTWTPTLDYCWWLTPSPTPSVTPNQPTATLDDWSLAGTQVFIEAHTLTPTPPPTQRPPRALCDGAPSPEPLSTEEPTRDRPFPTLDLPILPPPTWTNVPPQPAAPVYQPPPEIQQVVITSPPQVVIVTSPPQIPPPVLIVVTATPLPATATFTPTNTATSTETPTATFTFTATNTETPSLTPSPTPTLTETPTDTPSLTWTPSSTPTDIPPTETPLPTSTFTPTIPPTAYPSLSIVSGNCDGGHLTFGIQNLGGDLLEQLQYRLVDQFLLVNSTGLFGGIPAGQSVVVDLGNPEPGLWILGFDYLGQTVYSSQITCEGVL